MSGFFGIFNPKGGGINTKAFEQMKAAADRPGHDGIETYVDENIAMGHVMLRVSTEAQYDQQPLKSSCGNYILVGHFRLDYRDELGDKLGLTQSELDKTPDSRLVMMGYQKWKEKIVYQLEGDWAFIIFDLINNKIILLKDHYGSSAIFYYISNNVLFFSSYPQLFTSIPELELQIDYSQLLKLSKLQTNMDTGCTIVSNLYTIMSGNSFSYTNDNKIDKIIVPDFDFKRIERYKFLEDVISDFHNKIVEAISERIIPQNNGLLLSAGLDSSMIADYVNTIFKLNSKKIKTFTSFPRFKHYFNEQKQRRISEDDHVREFTSSRENITPFYIDASEIDFNYFIKKNKFYNFFNPIITPNTFWIEGVNNQIKRHGVLQVLNGQMGNYVVSWNAPSICFQYLINFQLIRFWSYLLEIKTTTYKSYFNALKNELLRPFFLMFRTFFRITTKKVFNFFKDISGAIYLKEKKISKISFEKFKNVSYDPRYISLHDSKKLRQLIFRSSASRVGIKAYLDAEDFGYQSVDPFVDKRLLEFSFQIDESYFNRSGVPKFIYWCLMKNKIADEIRFRVGAFPQAYDCAIRLANDKKFVDLFMSEELDANLIPVLNKISPDIKQKFFDLSNYDITKLFYSAEYLKYISVIFINKLFPKTNN